jgi:probable HAF family extracellular repeat protein
VTTYDVLVIEVDDTPNYAGVREADDLLAEWRVKPHRSHDHRTRSSQRLCRGRSGVRRRLSAKGIRSCTVAATFSLLNFIFGGSTVASAQTTASFQPLGLAPAGFAGVQSEASRASADGSVIVGQYREKQGGVVRRRGFRWQAATGMQDLGALNPNAIEVQPLGVSGDGSRIVGWARGMSGFQRPFLWTAAVGMKELVEVPGTDAIATGISRDGHAITGYFLDRTYQAFRWQDGVVTALGFLANEPDSFSRAVCGLGSAIVGSTQAAGGRAFRWTAATGMRDLGSLQAGSPNYALHCSADGTVAVGVSGDGKGLPPARWDSTGVHSLGTLGGNSGEAHGVSADGTIVVGAAGLPFVNGISEFAAFRWTSATKIQELSRELPNLGVTTPFCHDPNTCPPGHWFLQLGLGISADGNVLVGAAVNPSKVLEAYRAVVPTGTTAPLPPPPWDRGVCDRIQPGDAHRHDRALRHERERHLQADVVDRLGVDGSSRQTESARFQANNTLGLQANNKRRCRFPAHGRGRPPSGGPTHVVARAIPLAPAALRRVWAVARQSCFTVGERGALQEEVVVSAQRRGFASMDPNKQRELASKGGKAAHAKGTAHEWTKEEAREAGRKGGAVSHHRKPPGKPSG